METIVRDLRFAIRQLRRSPGFTLVAVLTLLVGVEPLDPVAIGGAVALLLGVTILATLIPARRATRVDPLVAMRDG